LPFANKFEPIAFRDIFESLEHLGSNRGIKSARNSATLHISCHLSSRVSKVSAAAMKKIIYHHSALPKMGYHHFDHFWSRSTTPKPFSLKIIRFN
jgi:DNA mismatch repair ATPase MutL